MIGLKNTMAHAMPHVNLTINIHNGSPVPEFKKSLSEAIVRRKPENKMIDALTRRLNKMNTTEHPGGV